MSRAYRPGEIEPAIYERWLEADVFAPDGAGSRARPVAEPFVIIQPPPNVTGSLHLGHAQRDRGRGPDDPPRADAGPPGAVPARPRPRLDRRPVRARQASSPRRARRRASLGRERYLERMWRSSTRRADDHAASSVASARPRLGPPALHHGRGRRRAPSARRSSGSTTRASPTGPRRSSTGAPAAARACPTWRSSPTPETGTLWTIRYHLIDEATGAGPTRTRRSPSPRPAPRRSWATPRWRCTPMTRATRRSSAARVRIPFVDRRRADHRRPGRRAGVRHGRREDHARPRPRRLRRPASAMACR